MSLISVSSCSSLAVRPAPCMHVFPNSAFLRTARKPASSFEKNRWEDWKKPFARRVMARQSIYCPFPLLVLWVIEASTQDPWPNVGGEWYYLVCTSICTVCIGLYLQSVYKVHISTCTCDCGINSPIYSRPYICVYRYQYYMFVCAYECAG